MSTNEKKYIIYLRATNQRIQVSKEDFTNYYRGINAFRIKQQRNGCCYMPRSEWKSCDMNCNKCPYVKYRDLSFDANLGDDDENPITFEDLIPDDAKSVESVIADTSELTAVLKRLTELMPQAIEIGKMRMAGYTDTEIAEQIGINRTTFRSRILRVKAILSTEFPDFSEIF